MNDGSLSNTANFLDSPKWKGLFFEPEVQHPIFEYRSKKIHNLPDILSKIETKLLKINN